MVPSRRPFGSGDEGERDRTAPDLAGRTILVAEDDPDNRELLVFVLVQCGARVIAQETAPSAIRVLLSTPCDVVVTDIGMPGDGVTIADTARRLCTPIIAVTGRKQPQDVNRMLAAGFQRILFKPVDPPLLCQAIVEVLDASAA